VYSGFFKRLIDFVLALIGLIVLLPFFLLVAAAIKLDSSGPVFFKQKRIMRGGDTFSMLKFRTMRTDTPKDTPTHLLQNPEIYISRVGRVLRKFSIDETIQILHILTGKMSIIGPRPALWNQEDLIELRNENGANSVRPGLTGLAQISGRDELPVEVKARLDGEYAQNLSFLMDLKCFMGTIKSVLKSDGVVEGGTGEYQPEMVEILDAVEIDAYAQEEEIEADAERSGTNV